MKVMIPKHIKQCSSNKKDYIISSNTYLKKIYYLCPLCISVIKKKK